jgi:hypothetical protein
VTPGIAPEVVIILHPLTSFLISYLWSALTMATHHQSLKTDGFATIAATSQKKSGNRISRFCNVS